MLEPEASFSTDAPTLNYRLLAIVLPADGEIYVL
jgi:hypothetical protein